VDYIPKTNAVILLDMDPVTHGEDHAWEGYGKGKKPKT
jgi:hypothetical protein